MARSLLTDEDIKYLDELQVWIRNSMEFSIVKYTPVDTDLVFIKDSSIPYLRLSVGKLKFVSVGTLRGLCENLVQQSCIYEVWLHHALNNAYRFSRALCAEDTNRFMHYFKSYHEIVDEDALVHEAETAIREARQALFGVDE